MWGDNVCDIGRVRSALFGHRELPPAAIGFSLILRLVLAAVATRYMRRRNKPRLGSCHKRHHVTAYGGPIRIDSLPRFAGWYSR